MGRRAATAPAVVSATTPLVCASASLATSVPSASTRPSLDKLQDRSIIVVRVRPHLASRFHGYVYVGDLGGGVRAVPAPLVDTLQFCATSQMDFATSQPAAGDHGHGIRGVLFDVIQIQYPTTTDHTNHALYL